MTVSVHADRKTWLAVTIIAMTDQSTVAEAIQKGTVALLLQQ